MSFLFLVLLGVYSVHATTVDCNRELTPRDKVAFQLTALPDGRIVSRHRLQEVRERLEHLSIGNHEAFQVIVQLANGATEISPSVREELVKEDLLESGSLTIKPDVQAIVAALTAGTKTGSLADFEIEEPHLTYESKPSLLEGEAVPLYVSRLRGLARFLYDMARASGADLSPIAMRLFSHSPRLIANGAIGLSRAGALPNVLWTPAGQIQVFDSVWGLTPDQFVNVIRAISARLRLEDWIAPVRSESGVHGPVFRITQDLDGRHLPIPILGDFADSPQPIWQSIIELLK